MIQRPILRRVRLARQLSSVISACPAGGCACRTGSGTRRLCPVGAGWGNWSAIDLAQRYVLVTNDFIAEGRDGYAELGKVSADGRSTNTFLLYTQSLIDYLLKQGTVSLPPRSEYSHQIVIDRNGVPLMD